MGSCARAPYLIAGAKIPGRIEAENYDLGGAGSAYSDTDPTVNNGNAYGNDYRTEEGVDIEDCTDSGGGHNVAWVLPGEWLRYIVDVQQSGAYQVKFRTASDAGGGTFRLEVDGTDVSGTIIANHTGGWQNWTTRTITNVLLTQGIHSLRLVVLSGEFNLNHITFDALTAIDNGEAQGLPTQYQLEQNYPNPFNPETTIRYSLPKAAPVRLEVINVSGESVAVLVAEQQPAGDHSVSFDGRSLGSGLYFYRLTTQGFTQTRKMMLVK